MTNASVRFVVRALGGMSMLITVSLAQSGCCAMQKCSACDDAAVPSLQARLDERQAEFNRTAPPEKIRVYEQGIETVRATGIEERALGVGDRAPEFVLPDATLDKVRLSDLLESGPVVLVWYRGGWCPYCNLELRAYQEALPNIRSHGATLVAISPELPDHSLSTKEKGRLEFTVLSDVGNRVARQYGLVFKLPDEVATHYKDHFDLTAYNGDASNELPLAATYVVDTEGVIRFAFADADYRRRAEPADVLRTLRKLE